MALSIGQGVDDTREGADRFREDLSVKGNDPPAPGRPGAGHEGDDTLGALRSLVSRWVGCSGHGHLQQSEVRVTRSRAASLRGGQSSYRILQHQARARQACASAWNESGFAGK